MEPARLEGARTADEPVEVLTVSHGTVNTERDIREPWTLCSSLGRHCHRWDPPSSYIPIPGTVGKSLYHLGTVFSSTE